MTSSVGVKVECRSDGDYAGRPLAVRRQGRRVVVAAIQATWRTPRGKCYQVLTQEEEVLKCTYSEMDDDWIVEEI